MRGAAAIAVAAVVCALALPARADDVEPVYGWDDRPARPADPDEWSPDIQPAPYFETWDMWFWADDGTFILVQFLTSSFGYGIERQGSGRLIIVSPDGANTAAGAPGVAVGDRGFDWDDNDWGWDPDRVSIQWIDCYFRGEDGHYETFIRGRDRTAWAELRFDLEEPMYRPGDGRLEYGWDRHLFFEQQAMPRFSFEGRVNRKANREAPDDWQPLTGRGYAEHTLTNGYPFDVAASFAGFRALRTDGLSIVFDSVTAPLENGGRTIGWATVALDGARLFEATDVSFTPTDVRTWDGAGTPYAVPWGYEITATSGEDWLRVVVGDGEMVSAESLFARVSAFLRAVLSAMMAPYDFEMSVGYTAWVHIDGHTAQVSGRGWSTLNFTR